MREITDELRKEILDGWYNQQTKAIHRFYEIGYYKSKGERDNKLQFLFKTRKWLESVEDFIFKHFFSEEIIKKEVSKE
jgi:hypothetical protein